MTITVDGVEYEIRKVSGGARAMYQAWANGKMVAGTYNKKLLKERIRSALQLA